MSIFKKIEKVQLVNHNENYVYCIKTEKNHNFTANGINVSNCCRLRNGIAKATAKDKEYSNSFGVGRNKYPDRIEFVQ